MMPLGQFRDTFIIAVDDEGIAIIDQHVAHERILFERITERLTSGRSRASGCSSRCSSSCRRRRDRRCSRTPGSSSGSGSRSRNSAATRPRVGACPALLRRDDADGAARAGRGSRRARSRCPFDEALKRIAATMACHAAVKANYPLTPREDGAHPGRAAADGVFDDLPARPAGDAAADPARSREELSAHIIRRNQEAGIRNQGNAGRVLRPDRSRHDAPARSLSIVFGSRPRCSRSSLRHRVRRAGQRGTDVAAVLLPRGMEADRSTAERERPISCPEGGVTPAAVTNPTRAAPLRSEREERAGVF